MQKRYKKTLIALAIATPLVVTSIVAPTVLLTNKNISNNINVLQDSVSNNVSSTSNDSLISTTDDYKHDHHNDHGNCDKDHSNEQKPVLTRVELVVNGNSTSLGLFGKNLKNVKDTDVKVTKKDENKTFSFESKIGDTALPSDENGKWKNLIDTNEALKMGTYEVSIGDSKVSFDLHPSFPTKQNTVEWGKEISVQVYGIGLVKLSDIKVKTKEGNDISEKFDISIKSTYINLKIKDQAFLESIKTNGTEISLSINGIEDKATIKIQSGLKAKIEKTETKVNVDTITIIVTGENLSSTNIDDLYILRKESDSSYFDSGFTKDSSSTSTKLVLTKKSKNNNSNLNFEVRLKSDWK
ncbi:hypothetical protein [Mycoplasmoides alvi]|uniref:hypothetical protein n=1 Tax=Mycoplasmoides alvi TaxID=78580 RepID=UPI00051B15BC|nr:hypothetical protein [Mycoplasmoides alvi]